MRKQTICNFSSILSFWYAQLALYVLSTIVKFHEKRFDPKLNHEQSGNITTLFNVHLVNS